MAKKPTNTGRGYETLTQQVFESLLRQNSPAKNIEVRKNITLQGLTTSHEIDVLWEFELGSIRYLTIVQCKDHGGRVKQGDLLLFRGVLADLPGQPRGVVVARSGFQSGAHDVARSSGIALYQMRPPKSSDWDGCIKTVEIEMRLFHPRVKLLRLVPDQEWAQAEKARTGISETIHCAFRGEAGELKLLDTGGSEVGSLGDVLDGLIPRGFAPLPPTAMRHAFASPTFFPTGDARMPALKLDAVEAEVTVFEHRNIVRIDAEEMVAVILKEVLTGKETWFDKQLKPLPAGDE